MLNGNDIAVLMSVMGAAVALAGFAGIVTSIDRSTVGASSAVITFRVRNLIVCAIASAFLAMLPILLDGLEVARESLWQFAAMIGAVTVASQVIGALVGRISIRGRDQGLSRTLFFANMTLGTAAVLTELAGTAGLVPARGAYLLGLFFLQYVMATLFYRMIHMADEAARSAVRRQPSD
jgi:hypothetical protein